MTKAIIIKIFKILWKNLIYKSAKELVEKTENDYDNKFLDSIDKFINAI